MEKSYGMLRIIKEVEPGIKPSGQRYSRVLCECECGNRKIIRKFSVTSGRTKSCGCLQKKKTSEIFTTHGMSGKRLNSIYRGMKSRCYNKHSPDYENYGERGITICEEWLKTPCSFYDWAKDKYKDGFSIERIDVNKGYCPDNCRFISLVEQARNKTNTFWVGFKGDKISFATACEQEKLNYHTAWQRIKRQGKSIKSVLGEDYYEV